MLDDDYRPLEDRTAEPMPPLESRRVRNVIYAFASVAAEEELAIYSAQIGRG